MRHGHSRSRTHRRRRSISTRCSRRLESDNRLLRDPDGRRHVTTGTFAGATVTDLEIRSGLETICTFNNTKKQAGVTLQKVWVDGKPGDTAALTLSRPGVIANATSTAPDAPSAGNTRHRHRASPARPSDLSEDLGAAGANYTTDARCTGSTNQPVAAAGNRSATLRSPPPTRRPRSPARSPTPARAST